MGDLKWMRESGLEAAVKKASKTTLVFGICGGYQMLGNTIEDPFHVEEGGSLRGMELLPVDTVLSPKKTRTQRSVLLKKVKGPLQELRDKEVSGYEIHMGVTKEGEKPADFLVSRGNVYGTYLHGIFDAKGIAPDLVRILAKRKGVICDTGRMLSYSEFKETQYEKLAGILREYLDMDFVYKIMGIERGDQK